MDASSSYDFDYDAIDGEPPEPDSVEVAEHWFQNLKAAAALLELVTTRATVKQAGQRSFVLQYLMKLSPFRTQRELAEHLDLTPARVSQLFNDLKQLVPPNSTN